jgi:hypothetical protein
MIKLSQREQNAISNLAARNNVSGGTISRLYLSTFDNILLFSVRISEDFLLKLQEILVSDNSLKGTETKIIKTILSTY